VDSRLQRNVAACLPLRLESTEMAKKPKQKPSKGWVYCRYRRVKNSQRLLDAHDYGYKAWRFPRKR
jgi:hypothetical protein